jgi:hypothetical protein
MNRQKVTFLNGPNNKVARNKQYMSIDEYNDNMETDNMLSNQGGSAAQGNIGNVCTDDGVGLNPCGGFKFNTTRDQELKKYDGTSMGYFSHDGRYIRTEGNTRRDSDYSVDLAKYDGASDSYMSHRKKSDSCYDTYLHSKHCKKCSRSLLKKDKYMLYILVLISFLLLVLIMVVCKTK